MALAMRKFAGQRQLEFVRRTLSTRRGGVTVGGRSPLQPPNRLARLTRPAGEAIFGTHTGAVHGPSEDGRR